MERKIKWGVLGTAYIPESDNDPNVEAICNPFPNTMHHELTIKALRVGKHALCKNLSPTKKEATEMFATAKESGVYLMEAFREGILCG